MTIPMPPVSMWPAIFGEGILFYIMCVGIALGAFIYALLAWKTRTWL